MPSTKSHAGEERNCGQSLGGVDTYKPLKLLLEYTISRFTMLCQNSIQARFGGVRLPTTIKQTDESITNLGDIVAVKEYKCDTILVGDHCIARLPIFAAGDSSVHLAFDLPHWSFAVDLGSMDGIGGKVNPLWTPFRLSHFLQQFGIGFTNLCN